MCSKHHRKEARKDDKVINSIIKQLRFRKNGRIGVIAGLPMVDKIRVGMSVDFFIANYTTGSLNVARICQKPGVGHMSRRMMIDKDQHIHHRTRVIDPIYVQDQSDPMTPTGFINYSIPWQAIYNSVLEILADSTIQPSLKPTPLDIPSPVQPDSLY